ncbi:MAG: DNA mismatch repair endonuclease MutL, partial [Phycisphaerae bacterium]|nr:DNA mismatch repair endonuclease MutL [Phycisphaerae bacterium]
DLAAISTMGFRGEALASIGSISRFRLTSRPVGADEGAMIEVCGDQQSETTPAATAQGTVAEVRQLFCHTPARRKFLRTEATEFGHINDLLTRLAMAHPQVGFRLVHNGRQTFDLRPQEQWATRCLALLGRDLAEGLLEFASEEAGLGLWGLAAVPSLARSSAKYQYIFVNRRPVRDRRIAHAIKEAYRGLIEPARQPMLVLFLTLDPAQVDVNVHPTKAEVRFADANTIHGQVLATVRQRLLGADLVPEIAPAGSVPPAPGVIDTRGLDLNASGSPGSAHEQARSLVHRLQELDAAERGFVYEQVKAELVASGKLPDAPISDGSAGAGPPLSAPAAPDAKPILQVQNTYLVTQDEQGIVIIDQHALHERMMFELLCERVRGNGCLESQRMLTPAVLDATATQIAVLDRLKPLLSRIGIEAEPLGPATIGIQAFATLLFDRGVDPIEFLQALMDRAEEDDLNPGEEAALHAVLDMMSCRAAIKAGDELSDEELAELLRRREQVERASNCPHGRPTTIRLSIRELERHFKRT